MKAKAEAPRELGECLRILRNLRGMKQNHLAKKAGVTAAMMSTYETGKCEPRFRVVQRILKTLGFRLRHLDVLLEGKEPEALFAPRQEAEEEHPFMKLLLRQTLERALLPPLESPRGRLAGTDRQEGR